MAKSLSHFPNLEMIISFPTFMEIRAPEGGLPKIGTKMAQVFSRKGCHDVNCRYWGDFAGMFRKKIETFSVGVITKLLRGASSTYHAVSDFEVCCFFDTLSWFASVIWKEYWIARMLGHAAILPLNSHWTMNISASFFWIAKSFWWL